jgi:hypothetical protein
VLMEESGVWGDVEWGIVGRVKTEMDTGNGGEGRECVGDEIERFVICLS